MASMRCVRPDFTTSLHSLGLALEATGEVVEGGDEVVDEAPVTAMCTEVGNTSLEDCEALTWSFG